MIKEIPMYTVICDNCGKDSNENEEYAGWNDEHFTWECAENDDWIEHNDNHYCPDCYFFDEDDNIQTLKCNSKRLL